MCYTNTWWIPWWLQGSGVYFVYCHHSLKNEPVCMVLRFLWKLMLFMLWKTSQNHHQRIGWGWKLPLEDIWPSHHYIYRHWGSEECRCICRLQWVLVCSLTSTLLLAWALNSSSFVIWQATSPFGDAAELALGQLRGSSSGRREQEDAVADCWSAWPAVQPWRRSACFVMLLSLLGLKFFTNPCAHSRTYRI